MISSTTKCLVAQDVSAPQKSVKYSVSYQQPNGSNNAKWSLDYSGSNNNFYVYQKRATNGLYLSSWFGDGVFAAWTNREGDFLSSIQWKLIPEENAICPT
eukprot:CAMPEP_0201580494 /NCGR_PEP_ID=MMETSP0190_2-20130828/47993_1 /ASSEMBLY_ACC=CAM_ASM_000263 /TAXON_ID=37353 /ORGANISM="Rosalina sp." /LENGTH=99 /DNA_ID=CAMNT_0048016651 /DNA_START=407 /DNA_END=706 /DNA_ORIENTATION=+